MFEHPRLGRALGHALADDGERALMRRSQRLGYDIRTVDRAMIAWTPHGWMALGLGSFDGAQIIERLWDRMLTPRRRGAIGPRALRAEGMIAEVPVAVAIEQACGVAAYAEIDTRRCDRAIATPSTALGEDPSVWLEWHTHDVPDALVEGDALIHRMHDLRLTARTHVEGLALHLTLEGEAPADGPQRLRRAAEAFAASELGDLIGANDWLAGDRATIEGDSHEIRVSLVIPFRGLDALAEVVRGRMGGL